jgi:hypothetical protein
MRVVPCRVSAFAGLVSLVLAACSDDSPSDEGSVGGAAGSGAQAAGSGGTVSNEAGSGGTVSNEAGASGDGEPTCHGAASELTIDGSYWMWAECNDAAIQGAWYCYADGISESDCSGKPVYSDGGYCLSGTTLEDPSGDAWGAAVAFELNHPIESGKLSYDASEHGVTGFAIDVVGSSGGAALRVGFKTPSQSGVVPFVEFGALDGEPRTLHASIADAIVPPDWEVPNAGDVPNPSRISDVELRVAGGDREATYDVCVVRVTPLFD